MYVLLLILYYIICTIGVARLPFIRKSGIRPVPLQLLFIIHVVTGWLHNYIAWRFYPEHGDIWTYFQYSNLEGYRLFHDFELFWYYNSHWDHFSHNGITFIHILLNPLSHNNLYINTLLFSFPVFLGNIALFRVFRQRFPYDPLVAFCVFLLPSTLFWTACVHREAVLYMLLGFLLFHVHRLLTRGFSLRHLGSGLLCFILMLCFRTNFALLLLPALYFWWLAESRRAQRKTLLTGLLVALLFLVLIMPILDLPGILTRRQQEFIGLEGHSRLALPAMDGTWAGLWTTLPAAIRNGCFEPLPGSGARNIYWAFALENGLVWTIVVIAILRTVRNRRDPLVLSPETILSPFGLFCLTFALPGMVLIGMMIPFTGAIVRYRSIYLLFLLAPFLHSLRALPFFQAINERLSGCLSHRL